MATVICAAVDGQGDGLVRSNGVPAGEGECEQRRTDQQPQASASALRGAYSKYSKRGLPRLSDGDGWAGSPRFDHKTVTNRPTGGNSPAHRHVTAVVVLSCATSSAGLIDDFGQRPHRVGQAVRLVRGTTIRVRCQKRRIGLDEKLLEAGSATPLPAARGILEADGAGQAEQPAVGHAGPGHGRRPTRSSGRSPCRARPRRCRTSSTSASASRLWIISGLPVRLARSMCQAKASRWVGGFGAALELARPVHVHAGLADGDDARMVGQPLDDGLGLVGERVGAGGVQRDGGVDAGSHRRPR